LKKHFLVANFYFIKNAIVATFCLKTKGSLAKVAIIPYEYLVKFGYKQDF
jgi:hypothetical protein